MMIENWVLKSLSLHQPAEHHVAVEQQWNGAHMVLVTVETGNCLVKYQRPYIQCPLDQDSDHDQYQYFYPVNITTPCVVCNKS